MSSVTRVWLCCRQKPRQKPRRANSGGRTMTTPTRNPRRSGSKANTSHLLRLVVTRTNSQTICEQFCEKTVKLSVGGPVYIMQLGHTRMRCVIFNLSTILKQLYFCVFLPLNRSCVSLDILKVFFCNHIKDVFLSYGNKKKFFNSLFDILAQGPLSKYDEH